MTMKKTTNTGKNQNFLTTRMFVIQNLSIRHYNKSLTMKTTTKTGKIQKFGRKMGEESVEAI